MDKIRKGKNTYYFVNILKACAALLIINSHYDSIYPIAALATGGAIGNALFFAISGFCLHPITKKFTEWFPNKVLKLYIPTLIMSIIALGTYLRGVYSLPSLVLIVIWPTLFWFIGALVLFYLLYYILKNVQSNREFAILGIILLVIYNVYYIFLLDTSSWVIESKGLISIQGYFKLIYYFAAMMLGKWFRVNCNKVYNRKMVYFVGMIISFISIYGLKIFISKNPFFMHLQFINQISVLLLVYFSFCFFLSIEKKLEEYQGNMIYKVVTYISNITLHLYLVQFMVINYVSKYVFPLNFILATILIFIFATLLNFISNFIYIKLIRKDNAK